MNFLQGTTITFTATFTTAPASATITITDPSGTVMTSAQAMTVSTTTATYNQQTTALWTAGKYEAVISAITATYTNKRKIEFYIED